MKYCLDISAIPYGTGVSRYTSNLAQALIRQGQADFGMFGTALRQYSNLKQFSREAKIWPLPPSLTTRLFHDFNLPAETLIPSSEVFHTWDWYLPTSRKTRMVITIHDLAMYKFPDIAHPEIKNHHDVVIERIKKFQPMVIAVSAATKTDLVELFGLDPDRITVVYEALPEESIFDLSIQDVLDTRSKLQVGEKPYLLMVGTLEPRKNYLRQIKAWSNFKHDFDLVIAGRPGWEEIQPEEGLHLLGPVTGKDLSALYSNAEALMYCSLDEGFGLPILEAFHHRIPVVTSNRSSMAEIANGSAVTVDPEDVDAIAAGITECLNKRGQLVINGEKRLNDFSWDKAARETLEVYKQSLRE